ncbi:hypothetical protein [Miltoncostaea oceani]|uniref:hypothetical protein n=1 Tax=Miltoncostaea oceani TaxID=2843216 RepID=UPI001C3E1BA7|nr:hypothetical protein [Miltoncostaea oceani]
MRSPEFGTRPGRVERLAVYLLAATGSFLVAIFFALASASALTMIAVITSATVLILVFAALGVVGIVMSLRGDDPVLDSLIRFIFLPGFLYLLFADQLERPSWPGAIAAALGVAAAVVGEMMVVEERRQERWLHHARRASLRRWDREDAAARSDMFV